MRGIFTIASVDTAIKDTSDSCIFSWTIMKKELLGGEKERKVQQTVIKIIRLSFRLQIETFLMEVVLGKR